MLQANTRTLKRRKGVNQTRTVAILSAPVALQVIADGQTIAMAVTKAATVTDRSPGGVAWSASWRGVAGGGKDVHVQVEGKLEMDSYLR